MGLEVLTPGFVLFWFGAGALLTSGLVELGILCTWLSQWLFFLLSSLSLLLLWQFYFKNKKKFRREVLSEERDPTVTGQLGVLTKAIAPGTLGEVEFAVYLYGLKKWAAEADESIEAGAKVRVVEARGVRLFVERAP